MSTTVIIDVGIETIIIFVTVIFQIYLAKAVEIGSVNSPCLEVV